MPFRLLLIAPLFCSLAFAQSTPKDFPPDGPKSDKLVQEEAAQVDQLLKDFKAKEALPLTQDLVQQRPKNGVYHEAMGRVYGGLADSETNLTEKARLMELERSEFRKARTLGNDSGLVRIMLENMGDKPFTADSFKHPNQSEAEKTFQEAEALYGKKQMKEAAVLYEKALELDPKMYKAALYAGDALFVDDQLDEAGKWFGKAIAIDPNQETAYRYWGDALMKQGKRKEAEEQFIDGILANPYTQASWVGLERWAQQVKINLTVPQIHLPQGPTQDKPDANGKTSINITMPLGNKDDPNGSVWLMYQMNRALWQDDKKRLEKAPELKTYRHSLPEETDSIRGALAVAKELKIPEDKLDPSLKQLRELDQDGMLEAWILLQHADQGIAQDYHAYREVHRQQLRGYILKYITHGA